MSNAITKIELDLGGKKVTLTPEQAKNSKAALNELFGKEIVPYQPYVPTVPYRYSTTAVNYCTNSSTLKLTA